MDKFLQIADQMVIYNLRTGWLQIARLYNEMAAEHDTTVSMAFVLLAINEEAGTPVTRIAPRMGMEPNSLSRILKSMEEKGFIFRKKDNSDKRMAYVHLTTLGKEKREIALRAVFRLEKAIVNKLDQQKLDAFYEVARHIPSAIDEFKEKMASYENS
ncbi:MAG: MarR family transcriptional regulator [Flavobacteriales bacterium]|nr:MarR family transcriptional regulator [Flavobacteriales bacterium]MCB9192176.1 MarR family transcriptional regulator [Flavobacteriales bacterium]MCB9203859.1 MarR family transcriptional regulator [Flavobacteriales bacterium]